jgi:hypothetical protein
MTSLAAERWTSCTGLRLSCGHPALLEDAFEEELDAATRFGRRLPARGAARDLGIASADGLDG